jgi:hypothetical protein
MLVSDPVSGCLVLYGGQSDNPNGGALGDTWLFCHDQWHRESVVAPGSTSDGAAAWDPVCSCVVLFGGANSGPNYVNSTSATMAYYPPTSMAGGPGRWVSWNVTPPSEDWAGVVDDMMAFDPSIEQLVLFGGACVNGLNCDGQASNTTYVLNGSAWVALPNPVAPPPSRLAGTMAYNPAEDGILLFSGATDGTSATGSLNDTWLFANGTWHSLNGQGLAPPARRYAAGAYDLNCNCLVVYGGLNSSGTVLNDTWEFGTYPVTLTEHGLTIGQTWSAEVGGITNRTTSTSMTFYLGNGTYAFGVATVTGYNATPASGRVTVNGIAGAIAITFAETNPPVTVPPPFGLPVVGPPEPARSPAPSENHGLLSYQGWTDLEGIAALICVLIAVAIIQTRRPRTPVTIAGGKTSPPSARPPPSP